jgi:serine/threonine protein phosphatase PrpC
LVRQEAVGALSALDKPELLFAQEMAAPSARSLGCGDAAVFSAKSPTKETANEDAAALIPVDEKRCVLAVADGVGGHPSGDDAARVALQKLRTSIAGAGTDENSLREAILDGIERANAGVQDLKVGAATTIALAEIDRHTVRSYHVGDSGLLVIGQRGLVKLQTVDHSPVGYAVEAGVLDEEEAIHHRDRHLLSNALGTEDMRVEVGSSFELSARDTLLIASDGLFDNLRTEEIAGHVRKGPLQPALTALVDECRARMLTRQNGTPSKPDDLTVIAFRLA